ncbi:TonB-dependent receptor [Myroides marinus]|uniref:Iron complex outermembrane recepter protein n=1 Tax=Myroides marinus TaxID=703342 RepID=A0A1H6V087_9FLAO|nr:TonB-dependent receptor [Myroides marinus]MDM1379404.1 TonB-dependent receptor [Myroides marinus]MDM1386654.1 TonB-dependent receptor [Myroides marinus]MDM1393867.1 TonB-dependent receptor [Myroides marinus]SEI97921.1 iron complex outermembrane recepter protein [Myroides marinus]
MSLSTNYSNLTAKLFSFILLLFTTTMLSQNVIVKVNNPNLKAVKGAQIYINGDQKGVTDKEGGFSIDWTTLGDATLLVVADGYEEQMLTVVKSELSSSLVVELKPLEQSLDEIVITAGRKAENIATIPSSVTIIGQKEMEKQMNVTTDISTILSNLVPGLGNATNKGTSSGQTLRGRPLLVLIDGIPQSTPLMNGARDIRSIAPSAIERVEVIKGATAIYGNGSTGGIINYITKKNKGEQSFGGTTVLGTSFNPANSSGTMGYKVSQSFAGKYKKWNYSVGASLDYNGVQRDGEGLILGQTDGLSNTYQKNLFAQITYDINDYSSIRAFYNGYSSVQHARYISKTGKYGQTPTIGIAGTDPGEHAGTPHNHNMMLGYTNSDLFLGTQLDVTFYMNSFRSMNRYVEKGTAWYGPGQTRINSNKKGLRVNLNTPFVVFDMPSEITYGVDWLNDVTDQDLTDARVYIPKMDMINIAPYAQLKVDIIDNLIFKAGIRYENANVKVNDFNTIATGPNNEGSIFVQGGKIPYKTTLFNAGLRYNKYEVFNPFVSFSQGFAINELGRILRRAKESTLDQLETEPIITNNYEVGFSSRFSIFSFTGSYYVSTSKLGANLVDVGGYLVAQREPERVHGFEITGEAILSPQWTVGGSYAYVEGKAEFDDGSKVYLNGGRISPPKATAFVYYTPNDKLNLQLYWLYSGSRDRFDANAQGKYKNSEGPVKDISLFNIASTYTLNKSWKFSVGIENLFNKTYYPVVSQYRALDADYIRGNGMQANLTMQYNF